MKTAKTKRVSASLKKRYGIPPPLKAIRLHCKDCMGGSTKAVKECDIIKCDLRSYRFGRNPKGEEDLSVPTVDKRGTVTGWQTLEEYQLDMFGEQPGS